MAARTMARRTVSVRRGPSKKLQRAQASLQGMLRRRAQEAKRREREIVSVGTAAAYGWMQSGQTQLPTIGNVEPAILYGAAAYVLPDVLKMGSAGSTVRSAGVGLLTVAAYNVAKTGSLDQVSGEVGFGDFSTYDD